MKTRTELGLTWLIGQTAAGGNSADQNVGTLTAGGATNTPGEIVLDVNNTSSSSGTVIIDAQITDNGTGAVTFVKAGVGSMKLRGHNTYSGGTYLLQGRVQMVGGEGGVGSGNADACGTGPIYILPGAYLFPSGTGPTNSDGTVRPVTNAVSIAGNGTAGEPLGAIRCTSGWLFNGPWTLIGDTTLGGNGGASGAIGAKLSGAFNLSLCSPITVNGTVCLTNSANNWSGTTTLNARNNTGANVFLSGNSEIIPNGFGKGNVVMNGFGTGTITWNLNGFSETINGLITSGTASTCTIANNLAATASTLTLGDNDQSGTFGGTIQDGTGTVALTKIGAGIETLSGTVSYSGSTTVNGGTLALISSSGALSSSAIQINTNAVLDVSGVSGGSVGSSAGIGIDTGRLIANASGTSTANLSLTNSHLQVVLNPATINLQVGSTLVIGGATNLLDISTIQNVASYPVQFTMIKYTGSIAGSGFNFGLGSLPTDTTSGYVSNNAANSSVDVVLFNGPKLLNWTASVNTNWDIVGTANWKFGATPVVYNDEDSPTFDDTASSGLVYLTTMVTPGGLTVSNNARSYLFTGPGNITGFASLNKLGTGTLTITNTGVDNYSGGVVISGGGTLIIGVSNSISGGIAINNSTLRMTAGNLPFGGVVNEGTLLFDAVGDIVANNSISGDSQGVIIKTNTDTVTLGGASTHSGTIFVSQGTLKAGGSGALGNGSTVLVTNSIATSATLDVNGQTLQTATTGPSTILVNGAGIGGNGVILNSGPDSLNALLNVTLAGDTSFGGSSGRWDIRSVTGFPGQLQTGGQPYNLTKVGTNQVSLVGVIVDSALGNITVQNGVFSVETSTSGLGDNTSHNLTVAAGATLQLFNYSSALTKPLVLNGNGVVTTLNNGAGANTTDTPILLNSGNCVFNVAGTSLTISDLSSVGYKLAGPGGLIKSGGGPLYINIPLAYAGATLVTNGILVVDALETNSSSITVGGGTLAGAGSFASPVTVGANGTLSPGDTNAGNAVVTLVISNTLSLAGTCAMDVNKAGSVFSDDVITNLTTLTLGGNLQLNIQGDPLTVGDIIPLFSFNSASGSFAAIVPSTPGTGLAWDTSHLTTDGTLRVLAVSTTPASIATLVTGNQLDLGWPADHTGWRLQVQTNAVTTGISSNWVDVPGSTMVNNVSMTIDPANGVVFFRMVFP